MTISLEGKCVSCFAPQSGTDPCRECDFVPGQEVPSILLPRGTVLSHEFVIGSPLGKPGGFGITYLAWDLTLASKVAVKEYLPREVAGRTSSGTCVSPHTAQDADVFRYGIERFLGEARTLAHLDHPNIVRVRRFFKTNGTAYLVMDYYQGITLDAFLASRGGKLAERLAIGLMMPILDGLRHVHHQGILHRDVKPSNIYLTEERIPILLDFGAARQAVSEKSRSLAIVMTSGFSPLEQYQRNMLEGPWTDVYACGATIYRLVTGQKPPAAPELLAGLAVTPPRELVPELSRTLSDALLRALALAPDDRQQNIEEFQQQLLAQAPAYSRPEKKHPKIIFRRGAVSTFLGAAVLLMFLLVLESRNRAPEPQDDTAATTASEAVVIEVLNNDTDPDGEGISVVAVEQASNGQVTRSSAKAVTYSPANGFEGTDYFSYTISDGELSAAAKVTVVVGAPKTIRTNGHDGLEYAWVPPGSFQMGCVPGDGRCSVSEKPRHEVLQKVGFWMGRTEVTAGAFRRYVQSSAQDMPSSPTFNKGWQYDDHPVVSVSWQDASAFCDWIGGELPTEQQWEYAARGGLKGKLYPWGDEDPVCAPGSQSGANFNETPRRNTPGTMPVASFMANGFQLYDMAGSVLEWCQESWYSLYLQEPMRLRNRDNSLRVLRGGSWSHFSWSLRVSSRYRSEPDSQQVFFGFRCIWDPATKKP